MKVLYLVPHVPNATKIRSHMQIRGLIDSGQEVVVGTLIRSDEDLKHIQKLEAGGVKVVAAPLSRWQMAYHGLAALPGSRPLQADLLRSSAFMARLDSHLQAEPPDVVHVEHLRMARYGLQLNNRWPVVWDAVDNLASLFRQASSSSTSSTWRLAARIEAPRLQSYERWLTGQFPATLVISEQDRMLFSRENPHADRVRYAPLGIPVHPHDESAPRASNVLIITGTMNYHPNIAAIRYFVETIFPLIQQARPDVELRLVGANPVEAIRSLGERHGIIVTGFVPSVADHLRQAAVALAPVTYGAGIQIKVLEAFLTETPLVATPQAIRGLDVHHEAHLLIADDPAAFAAAVLRLLDDHLLRDQLGQAGRRYVEQHHDLTETTRHLLDIYRSVIR
ncbi:MAG: glycosyltransferase [Anaerolineae bacterium]|nr:glycosyltransferase [Anaerolineae bacterium]